MKLEVGEYYLSAGGEIVEIVCQNKNLRFLDENENVYDGDGKISTYKYNTKFDLIAHIPKQLHKHILNEINSYYTDKDFKEVVDSVWGK